MGLLLNGVWSQESNFPTDSNGRFVRPSAPIRNWVTAGRFAGPERRAAASRPRRAVITSMSRSPAPGRIAP